MPYVELQQMLDEANAWGLFAYDKGCYVEELSDGVIDALVEHFPQKTSPLSIALFYRLDNAYSAVAEDATAFSGGRSPRFGVFIIGGVPSPRCCRRSGTGSAPWPRRCARTPPATAPTSTAPPSSTTVRSDAYGAAKFARLVELKAKYDPTDLLHGNARVTPGLTSSTAARRAPDFPRDVARSSSGGAWRAS